MGFGSKLFVMGGSNDDEGELNTVEVFDGSGGSSAPSMATRRFELSATVFGSKLFVMGGSNQFEGFLNTVEVFDGSGWSSAPSMTTKRVSFEAIVFDSKLFVMGGSNGDDGVLNSVEVFDGNVWAVDIKVCVVSNVSASNAGLEYSASGSFVV